MRRIDHGKCWLVGCLLAMGTWFLVLPIANLRGQEPSIHERIDALVEAQAAGPLAAQASDGEFLRRIFLDFAGRIPTSNECRVFLADSDPAKRTKVVDLLLASPDYSRRMAQAFHVLLMERLGDHELWQKYLRESFAANKPWDQMVREMLSPDADNEATRGAALFFSKRLESYGQNPVDVPGMVRDVGRLFMGIDVQCAQCHDHLFVDDYKQEFYQGLFAFVGQAELRGDQPFPAISEKPLTKKVEFMSVFVKQPKSLGPQLPGFKEVEIPVFAAGEEWEIKPDPSKKIAGKLKFSALKILSDQLPSPENQLFKKNIANRLWWLLMKRGLIHPLDLTHAGNAPSHPELLDLLANELAAHKFDMKWLLREIALTRAYQRGGVASDESAAEAPPSSYRVALERPLSSEQMLASIRQALGNSQPLVIATDDKTWTEWQARFDKSLANPPREPEGEIAPTVKAALFLMNDGGILGWAMPEGDNLAGRLSKLAIPEEVASEMYLAILSRAPTDEEQKEVAAYLSSHSDRRAEALRNLIWSLLASNEFCLDH